MENKLLGNNYESQVRIHTKSAVDGRTHPGVVEPTTPAGSPLF